jgi:predicted RNase H-like HicB family nuclease
MDNEKWFIAFTVEFGLNSCHGLGKTPTEALESFYVEKDAFIAFLYENKEPIPVPKEIEELNASGIFTVRTSPWIHSLLVKQSNEFDVSLNSYVNQLLSYGVGCDTISTMVEKKFEDMNSRFLFQTDRILTRVNALNYSSGFFELKKKNVCDVEPYRQAV